MVNHNIARPDTSRGSELGENFIYHALAHCINYDTKTLTTEILLVVAQRRDGSPVMPAKKKWKEKNIPHFT